MRFRLAPAEGPPIDVANGHLAQPDRPPDFTVSLGDGALRPGLINAHDHLHRNHYPRLGSPPYPDAYAWGQDLHARFAADIARARQLPEAEALLFGALKNLLGGVTRVVHHDPWDPRFDAQFPIGVVPVRAVHSLGFERDFHAAVRGDPRTATRPLCLHVAEGVTPAAADEVRDLAGRGLVDEWLLAVHLVGADEHGIGLLRRGGAAAVWCPTSNEFLFGRGAPTALLRSGVDVLLGTDALLTGTGTMLDELSAARRVGALDDDRLLAAVGVTAAGRLDIPVPSLDPGSAADVVMWRRPVLEARPADIGLVLVGGVPRLGDPEFADLFGRMGVAVERLVVGGRPKLVAAPLGTVAQRATAITPSCGRILH